MVGEPVPWSEVQMLGVRVGSGPRSEGAGPWSKGFMVGGPRQDLVCSRQVHGNLGPRRSIVWRGFRSKVWGPGSLFEGSGP